MIGCARQKYPELHFQAADARTARLHETFDYVICSDLVNDLWDVQQVLEYIPAPCASLPLARSSTHIAGCGRSPAVSPGS